MHDASAAHDAPRLGERPHPVGLLVQVVQRTQQEDRVGGFVCQVERAGVTDRRVDAAAVARRDLLDVVGDEVAVDDP